MLGLGFSVRFRFRIMEAQDSEVAPLVWEQWLDITPLDRGIQPTWTES